MGRWAGRVASNAGGRGAGAEWVFNAVFDRLRLCERRRGAETQRGPEAGDAGR